MKISVNITVAVAFLLAFGPILAAHEAEDDVGNEKGWAILRGRARVNADDVVIEAGVKADDVVVEARVNADSVVVKHANGLLRSIYNDYMASKQRNLMPAEGFEDDGNITYDDNSTDTGNFTKGDNSTDIGNILDGGKVVEELVWKEDNGTAKLVVEVTAQGAGAEALLQPAFEAYGFEKTGCSTYQCSGFLPIENFEGFAARPEVRAVRPLMIDSQQAGSKTSEAVVSLKVDLARKADTKLLGTGLKIGVMSDSFNVLGGYAADVLSGDLPFNVKVLQEGPPFNPITKRPADEGRAMAQLIHDIAPGAEIYFHSTNFGPESLAQGIQELADVGCDVIVDDVVVFAQPFFQDGIIAKSANDVAQLKGVPYFTAVGNYAQQSWEGIFKGSGDIIGECELHDFGAGLGFKSTSQRIITKVANVPIVFQWDDPWFSVSGPPGVTRDFEIVLFKDGIVVDSAVEVDLGMDAIARVTTGDPGTYELAIVLCTPIIPGATPPRIKWIGAKGSNSIVDIQFPTRSSPSWGHMNQPYVAAVGAANFFDTPPFNGGLQHKLASYSSRGGTPIYLDRRGARLAAPEYRRQPRFVATDGDITTFFGSELNLGPSGPGFYFFGTSAAAPNAAAVALLMLQVNPRLKPLEVYDIMARTAIDMGPPGWDSDTGSGYIDANAAVNMVRLLLAPPKVKTVPTTKAQKKVKAAKPKKRRKPRKRT